MARKQVAHRQYVAVEMHGAFGLSGGAAGECNQAHIVTARGVRSPIGAVRLHSRFQAICGLTAKCQHLLQKRLVLHMAGGLAKLQFF